MTDFEKRIYNSYLAVTRSMNNKPFRLRKNFDGFEDKPEYIYVKKLANLFNRHHNLNIDDFFRAPFTIYQDPEIYSIQFYTTQKAIKVYKIHLNKLKTDNN